MPVFLVIGIIAGIMLGLRFKVFVLAPAILAATAVTTVNAIMSGRGLNVIALTTVGVIASLQIGYFVGGILQVMAAAHLPAKTTVRYRFRWSERLVKNLVGIDGGAVSGVFNLEPSDVGSSDGRLRYEELYHEL